MPTNILSCFVFYKQGLADRMNLCLFVLALSIMTTRTMGALLATIVITMTLGNSILCFMHKVEESYDEATGHTSYHVVYADFTDKYPVIFYLVYDLIYNVIICLITPTLTFVVVAVATSITVIKLKMAIAWRASTSSGRGDDQSQLHQVALTKTLVIVSSIFVALSVPRTVLTIVRLSVASFAIDGYNSNLYRSVVVMSNSLMLSNSSVNFFVYYRSAKFRQELCALCSCRKDQGRATSGN
nr:hypothetical protein BaRGS_020758 [Batillaria attramentaria]